MASSPTTPAAWREYTSNRGFKKLPNREFVTEADAADEFFERGIYIEASSSKAFQSKARNVWLIADVLILDRNTVLTLQPWQSIFIYARVISTPSPSILNLNFAAENLSQVLIYCHHVDHAVSFLVPSQHESTATASKLGDVSVAGIVFDSSPGKAVEPTYEDAWPILEFPSQFSNLIRTQLRMASILYWTAPNLANDLCSFVIRATAQQYEARHLHLLAISIQQQILADTTTSHDVTYLPVLSSDHYRSALLRAIDIAHDYELGYKELLKQNADLKNLEASLDIMLRQADANLKQQELAANSAFARWQNAESVYHEARLTFAQRVISIRSRALEFTAGIDQYKIQNGAQLFLTIFTTVITIVGAVGSLAAGMPPGIGGPSSASAAIAALGDIEKHAKLQRDTVAWLFKYSDMMVKIYDLATKLVPVVKAAEKDPKAKLKLDEKYLTPQISAAEGVDASVLSTVAAWDRWMIESDAQMESAVSAGIAGAGAYRTQLREHAVDGKLAAQAQAMAIKTSGEYVQAVLGLVAARDAVTQMTILQQSLGDQEDAMLEAKTTYFDRLEEARTNILIRMRTVQLAHRYETLAISDVILDPLKDSMLEYKDDANEIVDELEKYQSLRADDPGPIAFTRKASNLVPGSDTQFHNFVIDSLKTGPTLVEGSDDPRPKPYSVTFTIAPRTAVSLGQAATTVADSGVTSTNTILEAFLPTVSGPFTQGYYFRVYGMRAFLTGVVPSKAALTSKSPTVVKLQITTSGIYSDVDADGNVLTFSTQPMSRTFQYGIDKDGNIAGKVDSKFEIDSIQENKEHINPTAFTQWTIRIYNPEDLDLDKLTDVELYWRGAAYS